MDTEDLLDRMRLIELREYGYTNEGKQYRGMSENDGRVRGIVAQELNRFFS